LFYLLLLVGTAQGLTEKEIAMFVPRMPDHIEEYRTKG